MFASLFGGGEDKAAALNKRFTIDKNKKFGEGGYGATYSATDTETGEKLAVKILDTKRVRKDGIAKECSFLESLNHPNVIQIKDHGLGSASNNQAHLYFIFMELAGGGELFDQVIDRGAAAMPEDVARGFMRQLLAGVAHGHSKGIAHRDLKLENVLLNNEGVVKVIDYGLAHKYSQRGDGTFDRSKPLKETCGSKSYAAPEVLAGVGYDGFAADMWSLGVSLFAMLSGFFPLDEASSKDWRYPRLIEAQESKRSTTQVVYSWYKRNTKHLSPSVIQLMDGMLAINPAHRATMEQVQAHPWIVNSKEEAVPVALLAEPVKTVIDDQGVYDSSAMAVDDGPVWRGGGAMFTGPPVFNEICDDMDDDVPVYRSLGGPSDSMAAVPSMAAPGLMRQKGCSNLIL